MKLKDLVDVPEISIFALINENKKKVYLHYSQNTLSHLFNIIRNSRYKTDSDKEFRRNLRSLHFIILEAFPRPDTDLERILQKDLLLCFKSQYESLGYTIVIPRNQPKFEMEVLVSPTLAKGVHLTLKNKGNKSFKMGIFQSMDELNLFLDYIKKEPRHVCAINEATRFYYLKKR